MCGIAGYKIHHLITISPEEINKSMHHRGPDHFGHTEINNYFLSNARLKIQDLNNGDQPFFDADKKYILVYNGELYNKEEIRAKLTGDYQFRSNSDTEVLFYALIENGIEIVKHLNGMFAFSFFDVQKNKIYIARDRFGVKPIYYYKNNEHFAFASEMKTLKKIIPHKNINLNAIKSYLQTNYIHDDTAIYDNCYAIKPGQYVELDTDSFILKSKKYWNLEINEKNNFHKKTLDDLLNKAVKKQLISDRPVGVFLSSGIDSATMAYYAKKHMQNVNAYNISFEHKDFDESLIASKLAKDLGINFHKFVFNEKVFVDNLDEYSKFTSSPIADLGMYPLYYLSKYVKDTSTVILSGDGGDEIFGGYPTIKASTLHKEKQHLLKTLLSPAKVALPLIKMLNKKSSWDYRFVKFYKGLSFNNNYAHYFWRTVFDDKELSRLGFESNYDNSIYYRDYLQKYDNPNNYFYADFKVWLVCNNFVKVDIATMASSIEARVPFLDNDLVDYMFSLNVHEKWDIQSNKKLLRETMRGKIPDYIVDGKKAAFHPPYFKWFANELYGFLENNLLESKLVQQIGLKQKEIHKILKDHKDEKHNNTYKIFNLLLLEFWLRNN